MSPPVIDTGIMLLVEGNMPIVRTIAFDLNTYPFIVTFERQLECLLQGHSLEQHKALHQLSGMMLLTVS